VDLDELVEQAEAIFEMQLECGETTDYHSPRLIH
jgi:hypothetical protein